MSFQICLKYFWHRTWKSFWSVSFAEVSSIQWRTCWSWPDPPPHVNKFGKPTQRSSTFAAHTSTVLKFSGKHDFNSISSKILSSLGLSIWFPLECFPVYKMRLAVSVTDLLSYYFYIKDSCSLVWRDKARWYIFSNSHCHFLPQFCWFICKLYDLNSYWQALQCVQNLWN